MPLFVYVAHATSALLFARLLPFACYWILAPASAPWVRAVAVVATSGTIALAVLRFPELVPLVALLFMGLAYFVCLTPLVHVVSRMQPSSPGASSLLLLLAVVAAAIGLPSMVIQGPAKLVVVVKGLEFALSAYSYVADAWKRRFVPEPLGHCAFFLIVNPLVVHASSGSQVVGPIPVALGLWRILVGASAIAIYFVLFGTVESSRLPEFVPPLQHVQSAGSYAVFVCAWLAQGALVLLVNAGAASVEIGAMLLLGYRLPERYQMTVLLSRNPSEWWARWNTYIGVWMSYYVFAPVAWKLRRLPGRWSGAATALAVTSCFVVNGLIHDAGRLLSPQLGLFTAVFAAYGLVVAAWPTVRSHQPVRKTSESRRPAIPVLRNAATGFLSWAFFVNVHAVLLSTLMPTLGAL